MTATALQVAVSTTQAANTTVLHALQLEKVSSTGTQVASCAPWQPPALLAVPTCHHMRLTMLTWCPHAARTTCLMRVCCKRCAVAMPPAAVAGAATAAVSVGASTHFVPPLLAVLPGRSRTSTPLPPAMTHTSTMFMKSPCSTTPSICKMASAAACAFCIGVSK